jgi:hypothetical protein
MKKIVFAVLCIALSICAKGQAERSPAPLKNLNIEFMMRGYFFAASSVPDKEAFGGFGTSSNYPKDITRDMTVPDGAISLIARPLEEVVFATEYSGLKVWLVNGTNERLRFNAQDSRLYIVQEAIDVDGKWKPVEYLPSSWCGNSYHLVFLDRKEYWEFAAARYTGKFKTRLRFRLQWQKSDNKKLMVYSNEFDGSVNAKQFTVKEEDTPTSIMDRHDN